MHQPFQLEDGRVSTKNIDKVLKRVMERTKHCIRVWRDNDIVIVDYTG